jgi:Uma2 family endonuclease
MEFEYAMATLPALITVEQFQELPLDRGPVMHELLHGEVVTLTRPKAKHYRLQKRLERLLVARAGTLKN